MIKPTILVQVAMSVVLLTCLFLALVGAQEPAKLGEFPFQVSIRGGWDQYGDFGILHVCSGTVIDERWVLTSGSCCNGDQLTAVEGSGQTGGKNSQIDYRSIRHVF